jgi:hypothetical protein
MLRKILAFLLASLAIPAFARTWNARTDWGATGNGKTNDYPAIQRGIAAMADGDTVVFPSPWNLLPGIDCAFLAGGIRVKCQAGATLAGPNNGTDIFANIQSNTAIGGSATTGCIFNGGGIQAYGKGGDGGQTLSQAITNLTFTYNTFENMTYGPNNFRSNGGIFIGGGSNHVVIRHNTSPTSCPTTTATTPPGKTYGEQYDPDGDSARAAIWFYGGSNYSIDHNTFLHDYQNIKACQGQQFQAQNILIHHNYSDSHHRMFLEINTGSGCGNLLTTQALPTFKSTTTYDQNAGGAHPKPTDLWFFRAVRRWPYNRAAPSTTPIPMSGVVWYNNLLKGWST